MVETIQKVLMGTLERLDKFTTTVLPSLIAALVLLLAAYLVAVVVRWLLYKLFKGPAIDKFLRQSGIVFMLDRRGRLRARMLVAESAYWCVILSGALLGLSAFDTELTNTFTHAVVVLLPKILLAGSILLAGVWLGQYLGRTTVVWAVNEDLPYPRRLALAVRVVIQFVAVVVAADQLDFARSVFLAAFILILGGAVLATSLAVGLSGGVRRYLDGQQERATERRPVERSVWNHL